MSVNVYVCTLYMCVHAIHVYCICTHICLINNTSCTENITPKFADPEATRSVSRVALTPLLPVHAMSRACAVLRAQQVSLCCTQRRGWFSAYVGSF